MRTTYTSPCRYQHPCASTSKKIDYIGQLLRITNGTVTYLHKDNLGSASSGTSASGAVTWREQYTPFGETILNPAANDNQAGFTGHIKDKATGLNYMQARYYDPAIGRFLSIDPVGFSAGNLVSFNRFAYVGNDPVNKWDPLGLVERTVERKAVVTGSRIRRTVGSITVEAGSLSQGNTERLLSELPDAAFSALDGKNLSSSAVPVGVRRKDGTIDQNTNDLQGVRDELGISHQIASALNPNYNAGNVSQIAIDVNESALGRAYTRRGYYVFGVGAYFGGLAQQIDTSIHEQNHFSIRPNGLSTSTRYFVGIHQRVENVATRAMIANGFDKNDFNIGCFTKSNVGPEVSC